MAEPRPKNPVQVKSARREIHEARCAEVRNPGKDYPKASRDYAAHQHHGKVPNGANATVKQRDQQQRKNRRDKSHAAR
jgi:hypothetical protein